MTFKPRYFAYNDQMGRWSEIQNPAPNEAEKHRDFEVFYDAVQVERTLGNYISFFEQMGKCVNQLPEFAQKFYFDMKRRIDHELATRNADKVSQNKSST